MEGKKIEVLNYFDEKKNINKIDVQKKSKKEHPICRFIEVNNNMINVANIRRVEFLGDYIHDGLLPTKKTEYITFNYCNIHTFDGEVIKLSIDLYQIEDGMSTDEWINLNRYYISKSMETICDILNPVKVTEFEYEL